MERCLSTFFEEPLMGKKIYAQRLIEDYGIDGEKRPTYNRYYQSKTRYQTEGAKRIFCQDCKVENCKKGTWEKCKYRIILLMIINEGLIKENKGLKEDIKGYKEILNEKD